MKPQPCPREGSDYAARDTLADILAPLVFDNDSVGTTRRRWANRIIHALRAEGWVICRGAER